MDIYTNDQAAIIGLHQNGYVNDFQLIGNGLLWVQGKVAVNEKDFCILEYHEFVDYHGNNDEIVIFGIQLLSHDAKGILLCHYAEQMTESPVIISKLTEMLIQQLYDTAKPLVNNNN